MITLETAGMPGCFPPAETASLTYSTGCTATAASAAHPCVWAGMYDIVRIWLLTQPQVGYPGESA